MVLFTLHAEGLVTPVLFLEFEKLGPLIVVHDLTLAELFDLSPESLLVQFSLGCVHLPHLVGIDELQLYRASLFTFRPFC